MYISLVCDTIDCVHGECVIDQNGGTPSCTCCVGYKGVACDQPGNV